MRRQSSTRSASEPSIPLGDRLLAALLSPLFFNLGLVIIAALMSKRGRLLGSLLYMYGASKLSSLLFIALPAAVGFLFGSAGTAKLMGHAFWTNAPSERNVFATLIVWVTFALCFYFALNTLPE